MNVSSSLSFAQFTFLETGGNLEGSYFIMGSVLTLAWLTPIINKSPNSAGKSFLDKGTLLTIAFI